MSDKTFIVIISIICFIGSCLFWWIAWKIAPLTHPDSYFISGLRYIFVEGEPFVGLFMLGIVFALYIFFPIFLILHIMFIAVVTSRVFEKVGKFLIR